MIRWFTRSDYCHVDIVDDDGTLIGARPFGGVARRPANYAAFKRTRIVTVPLPNETAAAAFLDAQMGQVKVIVFETAPGCKIAIEVPVHAICDDRGLLVDGSFEIKAVKID